MTRLVLMPIVAGFIATAGITGVLWAIDKTGWTNADMVRAVGSLITKSNDKARSVGLIVHFINGMIIAAIYLHLLSMLRMENIASEMLIGGLIGCAQGLFVSWAIIRFAHRHPLEEFRQADYQVAIAHTVGHIAYGVLMGAGFGAMRLMGFDVSPGI